MLCQLKPYVDEKGTVSVRAIVRMLELLVERDVGILLETRSSSGTVVRSSLASRGSRRLDAAWRLQQFSRLLGMIDRQMEMLSQRTLTESWRVMGPL